MRMYYRKRFKSKLPKNTRCVVVVNKAKREFETEAEHHGGNEIVGEKKTS